MHSRILKLLFFFLISNFSTFAQFTVEGIVTDEIQEPLIGATVVIKDTDMGTYTDFDGAFRLKIPDEECTIVIGYIGFKSKEIKVNETTRDLNIILEQDDVLVLHEYIPLFYVVVRASPIRLYEVAPVARILPQDLKRDHIVSIEPALNRITGLQMHSGALNTNRITIRGIGNRSPFATAKIKAYLDDIPLTSGIGETTIEDLDLAIIENVEVWKGPTASNYGAGLGGMIHLKSKTNYKQNAIGHSTTLGSYGLQRFNNFLNLSGKNKSLFLDYNKLKSDGYRDNNNYNRDNFFALGKINYGKGNSYNKKNTLSLLANYTKLKAFIPSSLNRDDYDNEPQKAAFTWGKIKGFEDYDKLLLGISNFVQKKYSRFSLYNKTSIFGGYRNSYESRPFNILQEASKLVGGRSVFSFSKNTSIETGIEFFYENYAWQIFKTNDGIQDTILNDNVEKRLYYNLFVQSNQVKITDQLSFTAGLNFNQSSYKVSDNFEADGTDKSGDYKFNPVFSPRLGFNYAFKQKDFQNAIYTNISHGFSAPTLEETLLPDGNKNPDIQMEKGWSFELGNRGSFARNKFSYELSLFRMHIKDLLVAERISEDQFISKNAGKTLHQGIEANLLYRSNTEQVKHPRFDYDIYFNYSFAHFRFREFEDDDNDYAGNELTGTPPHKINFGFDLFFLKYFFANYNFQFVDKMPMRDDNSIYSDAYRVSNVKFGIKKSFFRKLDLELSGGIRNVFNEKYASMILINAGSFGGNAPRYYYPGLPRNYFANVSLKYGF